MLDIKFIRQNTDIVREVIKNKKAHVDLDEFLALDDQRRKLLIELEVKNKTRNEIAEQVSRERTDALIEQGKTIKKEVDDLQANLNAVEEHFQTLFLKIPNIPTDDTPIGKDESENKVIRQWGDKPSFDFQPKEHWELGKALDVIDTERASEISGARFAYLKGGVALLELALIQHALSIFTNEKTLKKIATDAGLDVSPKAFIPVIPPVFIRPEVFSRMGRLEPADDRYYIPTDDLYLIGSAEHTLGPLHMDQTLSEDQLPIRYIGFSTAFRREAGSYGKDTKGILRVHQFDKLEMESFTLPEQSLAEQNFFVAIQEHILQSLKLPYQVVAICTGDMGAPDARQIDIETWLPGQDKYRETHTADLMTDYQARRLKTKVRRANGESEFVHMNDATAVAGRMLIAIMESYQTSSGTIAIPEALQPYMFGLKEIK